MELHEQLSQIRQKKKLKIQDVYDKIISIFGAKSLSYRTLLRIFLGQTTTREQTLYKICIGLGITQKDLEQEAKSSPTATEHIKLEKSKSQFVYNEKAYANVFSGPERPFLASELNLEPKAKTKIEKTTKALDAVTNWVYVSKGRVACHVGKDVFTLKNGECLFFDGSLPYYFENKFPKKSRCLIVQSSKL